MATIATRTKALGAATPLRARLTFLGGAGTVTGSCYLLETGDSKVLIDCGLFQGSRKLKALNWSSFPVPLQEIGAVILTHAHIDHVGLLPRLVSQGLNCPVYASEATCDLLRLALPDSAHLQEQDALYANKKGFSRHKPAMPLYTTHDAQNALALMRPVRFFNWLELSDLYVTWHPAGHILGSAIVEVVTRKKTGEKRLVFSGDLGRFDNEIMKSPTLLTRADILLVESTYGDRFHADESIEDGLVQEIAHILRNQGMLLIPAFAVGRTQQVLYYIRKLQDLKRIPIIPVFIDSPMAVDASGIYCKFGDDHNLDVDLLMNDKACPLRCEKTDFVRDVEESKALNTRPGPGIIISASGMCNGGRILHHLKWRLPSERNSVLFVGYQAAGTRGRRLMDGADRIRIHGEDIPVRARIAQVQALSGHADQRELLRWLAGFSAAPEQVFITHGESDASRELRNLIGERLGWQATIPSRGDSYVI